MHKFGLMLLTGLFVTCGLARPAEAIKQFQIEFEKLYLGEASGTELADIFKKQESKDEEKALKKLRCLTCHQGKKKKHRNAYGMQLSELLDKKKDKKDKEKIIEALKKVAEMRSDPKDEKSPTFGDLIKQGKFPGGSLEDLQKEPEGSEEEKKEKK